jgi:cobalt-zinc-cadmium efflux system outer membrane protein
MRSTRLALALSAPFIAGAALAEEPLHELAGALRVCTAGPAEAVARAERARGEAAVVASRVLPNPSLRAEHQGVLSQSNNGEEWIVGLSVPLGIGGRRFLLQDAARARRQAALADAHATLFESALAFREAYLAAAVDRARLDVLTDQQAALDNLTTALGRLSQSGEASAYDFARQQMQARLHRRLTESAKAKAATSLTLLEAWVGTPVALPPLQLEALAGGAELRAAPAELGKVRHPRVESLEAESVARSYEARASRRRWVPDLDLFAGYRTSTTRSSIDQGFEVSIGMPVTLFDHGQGEASLAEAERAHAHYVAQALQRQNESGQRAALRQLEMLAASQADFERAAADAMALQRKAARLYSAGESSITELIDAFRMAEDARLGRVELAREMAIVRLSLMRSSGTLFDDNLDKACGATAGAGR